MSAAAINTLIIMAALGLAVLGAWAIARVRERRSEAETWIPTQLEDREP